MTSWPTPLVLRMNAIQCATERHTHAHYGCDCTAPHCTPERHRLQLQHNKYMDHNNHQSPRIQAFKELGLIAHYLYEGNLKSRPQIWNFLAFIIKCNGIYRWLWNYEVWPWIKKVKHTKRSVRPIGASSKITSHLNTTAVKTYTNLPTRQSRIKLLPEVCSH